ncbi:predicted protein [Sclerotinia sclerotiorum 1980 UF-70]|uniref:Uncharacterized protein n=1 Tax=Sclerotinia sclerotiorum (strain ATCC 18683 / 1980 / Ss-1) TaxID=665079 RepID=A7F9W6_SCLS1|nr:predicted protein [Sclerotinia sclerotiorum 1980 UF-70]EDO00527.1 predicted protein [Sclerotinia sclerotiorum 1980 UF-70]
MGKEILDAAKDAYSISEGIRSNKEKVGKMTLENKRVLFYLCAKGASE